MSETPVESKNLPVESDSVLLRVLEFEGKQIRKLWFNEQWYYSVVDVIGALTDSPNPRRYWADLKQQMVTKEQIQLYAISVQLKMPSADGKFYETDCANEVGLLRIIQSVPSPNAEPFKQWLARVGHERAEEERNPDLIAKRAIDTYKRRGKDDVWISERLIGIQTRKLLTDEWKVREVKGKEFGLLTNTIYVGTFGLTAEQMRQKAKLKDGASLRDSMDLIRLAITNLAEVVTLESTKVNDCQGFVECKESAEFGASVARNTQLDIDTRLKKKPKVELLNNESNSNV